MPSSSRTTGYHPQRVRLLALSYCLKELHEQEQYIARSDYKEKLESFSDTLTFYNTLEEAGDLEAFCARQGWQSPETLRRIRRILAYASNPSLFAKKENEKFLSRQLLMEKDYLDHILDPIDSAIDLDENQRRIVLTDEDYMLVIAGAGAGKTTTIAAKVRYLVEKKGVQPNRILIVSFTNKAVDELRTRINKNLSIDCPIGTFHATGNTILKKQSGFQFNLVREGTLYQVINRYLRESVLKDPESVHDLILFFGSYFEAPEGDRNRFHTTLKSELGDYHREITSSRSKRKITLQAELLRSSEEVEIANFLYLHGLDYTYESIYPYHIPGTRKPYTPDFLIMQDGKEVWLEHFGISEDGKNDRYSDEELSTYKMRANQKYLHHKAHGTHLIFTYSSYNDGRSRMEHLKEKLIAAGFRLESRDETEVLSKLTAGDQSRYVRRLVLLLHRFIENFKTNGYPLDEFDRMKHSTDNVRSRLFLSIAKNCYIEYQRFLEKNRAIDFQDMINESTRLLMRDYKDGKQSLSFDYIIVDEYQDISRQRFDLVTALHKLSDAKIIAVGDDWQSIYAFSGSDITLFTHFSEEMGYASQLKINRTYRNSQELIDIAGGFIQKNWSQISKSLISKKHIKDPIIIYTYDQYAKKDPQDPKSGANYAMAKCVEAAIGHIISCARSEGRTEGAILLIGRFNFDGHMLQKSGLFEYKTRGQKLICLRYPAVRLLFMTAHASKGLGYDDVIVLNGRNERYGFPSKIEDDPLMRFVVHQDTSIEYAEERRLFYVALTRTKNRVYCIAPEQNPSEFLLELKKDNKEIILKGPWNDKESEKALPYKPCPICGYPLTLRWKPSYGLRLYICSNEPEICDFMTNDIRGGKLSICKCERCRDGYLIVRPGREGRFFLGCTNYRADKKGCNNTRNS